LTVSPKEENTFLDMAVDWVEGGAACMISAYNTADIMSTEEENHSMTSSKKIKLTHAISALHAVVKELPAAKSEIARDGQRAVLK
jgi:hypothetical protein